MDFETQIKQLRTQENLTQEQFAQKLNITRQAVSNWENNRNLPDIEMLIIISDVFDVSIERLLLKGGNMTKKIINDGSESRRAKMNLASSIIGGVLMLLGVVLLVVKSLSVEYVDELGVLHENFFLLPIGFLLLFCGVVIILGTGIRYMFIKQKG